MILWYVVVYCLSVRQKYLTNNNKVASSEIKRISLQLVIMISFKKLQII